MPDPEPRTAQERLAELGAYVDAELGSEWLRKTSLESRTLAVLTANLTTVTLFLALRGQFELADELAQPGPHAMVTVALSALVGSVVLAVLNALPLPYKAATPAAARAVYNDIVAGQAPDTTADIVDVRLTQLEASVRWNRVKSALAAASVLVYGAGVGLLVVVLARAIP